MQRDKWVHKTAKAIMINSKQKYNVCQTQTSGLQYMSKKRGNLKVLIRIQVIAESLCVVKQIKAGWKIEEGQNDLY